jgi:hypothetical protein
VSGAVIFYKTAGGKWPVQEFLDSLPGKAAQKVGGEELVGTEEI